MEKNKWRHGDFLARMIKRRKKQHSNRKMKEHDMKHKHASRFSIELFFIFPHRLESEQLKTEENLCRSEMKKLKIE